MVKEGLSTEESSDESKKEKKTVFGWKQSKYSPEDLKKAQDAVNRRKAGAENSGK